MKRPGPKVTKEIRAAIIDWHARRRALGTVKTVAHEHGLSTKTVNNIISYYMAREAEEAEKARRVTASPDEWCHVEHTPVPA